MITRNVILSFCAILLLMVGHVSAQPERAIQFQKYIVKEGETPGLIAEKFNVKKKDFLMLNNFPSNVILKAGEEVLIRRLNEDEKPIEEGASGGQYAARNGASLPPSDKEENEPAPKAPVKAYQPNADVQVKGTSEHAKTTSAPAAEPPKAAPAPAPAKSTQTGPGGTKYVVSDSNYHIVEKGQTFYRIALIYGLTVDKLKELNNMTNTTISVGQKLKVK